MNTPIVPRSVAAAAGLKKFFSGVPCKHGHLAERRLPSGVCLGCERETDLRRLSGAAREDRLAQIRKAHHDRRDERLQRRRAAWGDEQRAAVRAWRAANPAIVRALNAERKRHIKRATPPWADLPAIRAVYLEAERLSAVTGVVHHVDHEIPLRGELVCGLHVQGNLRPLPWRENLQKWNKVVT